MKEYSTYACIQLAGRKFPRSRAGKKNSARGSGPSTNIDVRLETFKANSSQALNILEHDTHTGLDRLVNPYHALGDWSSPPTRHTPVQLQLVSKRTQQRKL
eukprot:1050526-Pelagomonas_calceolata.AAC.1